MKPLSALHRVVPYSHQVAEEGYGQSDSVLSQLRRNEAGSDPDFTEEREERWKSTPHLSFSRINRYLSPAQLHGSRFQGDLQHLLKQPFQCCQMDLTEIRKGAEVRRVARRQHTKGNVLHQSLLDAPGTDGRLVRARISNGKEFR